VSLIRLSSWDSPTKLFVEEADNYWHDDILHMRASDGRNRKTLECPAMIMRENDGLVNVMTTDVIPSDPTLCFTQDSTYDNSNTKILRYDKMRCSYKTI
ncbi:hypothetical protein Pmar_PMAR005945, partial [Perkinsus marinus ATCC 50983]